MPSSEWEIGVRDRLDTESVASVEAIIDRATALDGTAPLSEQAVHGVTADSGVVHRVVLVSDHIVGYSGTTPEPSVTEVVVDPDFRGRGVGRALVDASLGGTVWAHGNLPAARAVASNMGLSNVRELMQMRLDLTTANLPEVVVPENISLRTYRGSADDAELLRVNNAAFSWHPEQGGWTQRDIDERRAEEWFDPAGIFMAFTPQSDDLLGFHWTKVHADEPPIGEVYVVGIDPSAQGRGLGRLLTLAGLHYLQRRGLEAVLLYVEADNKAAVHTYERLGFTTFHVDVAYARS